MKQKGKNATTANQYEWNGSQRKAKFLVWFYAYTSQTRFLMKCFREIDEAAI